MIANGKPEPDTYLVGAQKLGLDPAECIALEDSPNGVTSAYRAGCKPVMIPDLSQPDDETRAKLFGVCDDLSGVIAILERECK
jgi:beta-phosphoglucomutase-like phosphatase (HAD superfamily)